MTNTGTLNIQGMRKEVEALGGSITTLEEVPPHIEAQMLLRALGKPEYIEIEGRDRMAAKNNQTLAERIKAACDSTPPNTREREKALKRIRWVLRDQNGNYAAVDPMTSIIAVDSVKDAIVFDGRDNEEVKRKFYNSVTGMTYAVELI
jgi:hypothetical protein